VIITSKLRGPETHSKLNFYTHFNIVKKGDKSHLVMVKSAKFVGQTGTPSNVLVQQTKLRGECTG
jgi:hypothetical protein